MNKYAELKLVYAPSEALNHKVDAFDDALTTEDRQMLCDHMVSIMTRNNGVGLAANQINLNMAVFVMKYEGLPLNVINPEIINISSTTVLMKEGCLSEPGLYISLKRPRSIQVKFENVAGDICELEMAGMDARVFLHEYDHLQGIMFTDRVGKAKLDLGRKKQKKLLHHFAI